MTKEPSRDLSVSYEGEADIGRQGNGANVPKAVIGLLPASPIFSRCRAKGGAICLSDART
jgi:hypothetical protein